ncbi:DUF3987 domain-containing protein [Agrobacterium salinitolerans]|uniref:DUF3987 domain-containing protein n=1 Tax=Agrobacterium salinitolerans TaxID=1183413 RepID=UPI003FCEF935
MPKLPKLQIADTAPTFDEVAVREHVEMIHTLAKGIDGILVVSTYHANPSGDRDIPGVVSHHAVGDVDGMVDSVMAHASTPNANVFAGLQVMRKGLKRGARGGEADIVAVLGLVVDLDADTGRAGEMPVTESLRLETSPGNFQPFILFDSPLPVAEAKPLASSLRRATSSDHGTADVAHVWRIPGTLNWPNTAKLNRGRPANPVLVTFVETWDGSLVPAEELRVALKPWASENSERRDVTLGDLPAVDSVPLSGRALEMLAANDVGDRSEWAAAVVEQLAFDGLTAEQSCAAFLAATGDWFARYEGKDAAADFARLWGKFGAHHAERRENDKTHNAALAAKLTAPREAANDNVRPSEQLRPVDPWEIRMHPQLPAGLLPKAIEDFAVSQSEIMGVDAGGLAVAALAVCAAAIPDSITLKVKRHDDWEESARLWVALIGNPSAKKSPIINAATRPLRSIDDELVRQYLEKKRKYDSMEKAWRAENPPPGQIRARIEDVTVEAVQEILKDSRAGVLLIRDELSGWFGSMEKYGSGKGAAADRSFWLQTFNGGGYSVNRVGRGVVAIDNLSVSMLGGIQPEPIRRIAADAADDGLLQRLFPVCLGPSSVGMDVPASSAVGEYGGLVRRLHQLQRPMQGSMQEVPLKFDAAGQDLRQELSERHHDMQTSWEILNKKLAAHVGKYDGLFARLCIVFHCIESTSPRPASVIPHDVARRAAEFLHEFLFPHALAFYQNVLGLSDKHDAVLATAGWILAHQPEKITVRDVRRGDRTMREMDVDQAEEVLRKLDAMSWVEPLPSVRRDSVTYVVNPNVYSDFAYRAEKEKKRRERVRELIASQ